VNCGFDDVFEACAAFGQDRCNIVEHLAGLLFDGPTGYLLGCGIDWALSGNEEERADPDSLRVPPTGCGAREVRISALAALIRGTTLP
jgi:hypothetical protein